MSKAAEKLEKVREKLENVRKELREFGEKAVREALSEFFDAHPQVEALRWEQYTPHFNDGDACVFSVHEVRAKLKDVPDDEEDEDYGHQDGFLSAGSLRSFLPEDKKKEYMCLCYPPNGEHYNSKTGKSNFSNSGYDQAQKLKEWAPGADKDLQDDLRQLNKLIQNAEEALQAAFGDHAQITATRKKIEVEEYEHD